MAKKVVNVVYKVDDSALGKTKVTVQQLAAETKKSEQAMTNLGKSAKGAGDAAKDTYTIQRVQLENLRAKIDQTSQSDTARMKKLTDEYKALKKQVDDFNKSLQNSKPPIDQSVLSFINLNNAIKTALSVAAIKQAASLVLEMNKLAGQVEGVQRGFAKAFGPTSSILLENLKKSTHGTVSELLLMQKTLQATNLGVSVEHLGTLFEFAAARAQQTGESVDYLVDSLVTGIGRKSLLRLDNLGLSATRLKEEFGGVAIASKSVGEVTAGVAAIAKAELDKMGGYVENSSTKVDQLAASWEHLKQRIADTAQSSGIVGAFSAFLDRVADKFTDTEDITSKKAAKSVADFLSGSKKTTAQIQTEINARIQRITVLEKETAELNASLGSSGGGGAAISKAISLKEQEASVNQEFVTLLLKELDAQSKQVKATKEELGIIERLKLQIEALNEEKEKTNSPQRIIAINEETDSLQRQLHAIENMRNTGKPFLDTSAFDVEALKKSHDTWDKFRKSAEAQLYAERLQQREESKKKKKEWDAQDEADEKAHQDRIKAIKQAALDVALGGAQDLLYNLFINRQADQEDIEAKYADELTAAGNNEKAKKAIQRKIDQETAAARERQAEADKQDAITKIEIDTAINVIRSIVNGGGIPAGLPFGLLAATAGAIQIATVKSVKTNSLATRAFKDGEVNIDGPGTSTSDSIPSMLSKGESVINAAATSQSKNLLEAINDRRIDDRILTKLAGDGGRQMVFNDSKIIAAIESNKPDYVNQGYTLMEHMQVTNNFKRIRRAKVMGK